MKKQKIKINIDQTPYDSISSSDIRGVMSWDSATNRMCYLNEDGTKTYVLFGGATDSNGTAGSGTTLDGVLFKDGGIQLSDGITQYSKTVTMSAAEIIASTAGGFAHANGLELVAGAGTGYVLDLVSAVLVYDGDGTGYTAGGNVTINIGSGGAAITGLVSAANSFGATGDKVYRFMPLSTAALSLPVNTGINIVSSVAFTTGGAAGTAIVRVIYNVIATGL